MADQSKDEYQSRSEERWNNGKEKRKLAPRSAHGDWTPTPDRPDPISLLQAQDTGRLQHLLPIKYGRMVASPFAFLRGSAVVMAADLAATPATGLEVVLCGDAHLSNFGVFATPERNLVFDINDFDEAYPGPWEWDVKRLAASAVVAGRENGFKEKQCKKLAQVVAKSYREYMSRFAKKHILDTWYFSIDAESVLKVFDKYAKKGSRAAHKTVKKARTHTHEHSIAKLTEFIDGRRQIINDPPLIVRLSDLLSEEQREQFSDEDAKKVWLEYLDSLPKDRRLLLSRFRIADAALRVGGVGSVGTRCTILLLEGYTEEDAIILQQKEAGPSALAAYLTNKDYDSQAERVVVGQRLIQASSDIFLGWVRGALTGHHYYWRQLKDMKGSFDVSELDAKGLKAYLAICSICLARAHARTGDAAAISGYLGSGKVFDKAIGKFAVAYADQTVQDHQALVDAVESGRVVAEVGV